MSKKSLIILLLYTSMANGEFPESSTVNPVSFGEECNITARCDPRARLACNQGTCQCMKKEEMSYDFGARQCLVKAGERCLYILGERSDNTYYIDPYSCVRDASCSEEERVCRCNQDYYENLDGTCWVAGHLGEPCTENRQCLGSRGFQCIQGTCQCDSTSSEYNTDLEHCVGLAGSQCIQGQCTEHADCATNMCVCREDYFWDAMGKCRPKVGLLENCTADFQCKLEPGTDLKCIKGICTCDPSTSVYASVRSSINNRYASGAFKGYEGQTVTRCVPLPGKKCLGRLCAPRAYCKDYNISPLQTCTCEPSLTLSKQKTCAAGFDGQCTAKDECLDGLACVDNRCKCEFEDQVYDRQSESCLSKFGGSCNTNAACIKNSYCQFQDAGGPGLCVCNEGFVPDAEDSCDVAGGGRCSKTADCDSIANLQCVNGFCQCKYLAQFDPIHRKCVGKVGSLCSGWHNNACIKNAKCEQTHPRLPSRCVCEENYRAVPGYTCHLNEELKDEVEEDSEDVNAIPENENATVHDAAMTESFEWDFN